MYISSRVKGCIICVKKGGGTGKWTRSVSFHIYEGSRNRPRGYK